MIGYVTVGTNDLKKAGEFYDKLCSELGIGRFMTTDRLIAWGGPGGGAGFGVALPYDGKPMSVGNGVMAAFGAKDKAQVDRGPSARAVARRHLRGPSRPAQRTILCRLFPRPRRQQAQCFRDGLITLTFSNVLKHAPLPKSGSGAYCLRSRPYANPSWPARR